ncbi:D-glucuronyl C5-epimerase family protein [Streptomyces sp. NPDC051018]|uniref:D-glucuronyl C5-epimerase family protein n=1 Tax=Streptomyces sp. NPDC051018 TaxID=3365639 RepID=UPI00379B7934
MKDAAYNGPSRRTLIKATGIAALATGGSWALEGRSAAAVTSGLPFQFKTGGYTCVTDVPEEMQPWRDHTALRVDTGPHDAEGVRMHLVNGRQYDHPVSQIQYGLQNVTSYRQTQDDFYLKRAQAQAKRLIDRKVRARAAWWFPYPFDWSSGAHKGVAYKAPWYSGMAQGEALSLFSQLALLDGVSPADKELYRKIADGAFASLLVADNANPWVVAKDRAGYLWIHEYPKNKPTVSDFTYNGFMFAALGLWDYHKMTGNPLAEKLFDGSLTTLLAYYPNMRNTNWMSDYCLTHGVPNAKYHGVHVKLMRQLHWLSGSRKSAHVSDMLMDDYPHPALGSPGGQIALAGGQHTFYKFGPTGAITATKKLTFNKPTSAPASQRIRIQGRGIHYQISAGTAKGWYTPEAYPKAYLRGEWFASVYRPTRVATFPAAVSIGCIKVAENGDVLATKTVRFAKASTAPFDRRAVVNGRPMVHITAGSLTDFWAPASQILPDGR